MEIKRQAKSGLVIGVKDRSHKYLQIVCSQCDIARWVREDNTRKPKFTNICRKCNSHNQTGGNNGYWKGGVVTIGGYTYTRQHEPNHHRATKSGYVYEHILIWEQVHQKRLPDKWVVHHLNGIKNDNRPENLVALPDKTHKNVLAKKSERIRELEAKVKLLEKALDNNQMIFKIEEN